MSFAKLTLSRLSVVILLAVVTQACGEVADEPPSVIMVMLDAMRRDHSGVYGYSRPTTPFLDELSRSCTVFDEAYSQASQTFNSTSTLFTSRYFPLLAPNIRFEKIPGFPKQAQKAHAKTPYLIDANRTLAEELHEAGFETLGVFTNPHHHRTSGFWQGFSDPTYLWNSKHPAHYAPAPRLRDHFLEWHRDKQPDSPYFAYLHFMDPHFPQTPPMELRRQFVTVTGRANLFINGRPEPDRIPTENDLTFMKALYDTSIRWVDDTLRELVAELKKREAWSNLIFIVTSDHGDEFMDHGGLGHGKTLEKEQIHIPLLICRVPSREEDPPKETRVTTLVRNLDLAPTVLDLVGLPIPGEFEGTSLLPWILDPESDAHHPRTSYAWVGSLRSFTTPRWHFIWDRSLQTHRLYRNDLDPTGLTDRSAKLPAATKRLSAVLLNYERKLDASRKLGRQLAAESEAVDGPSDEVLEQLKTLGYIN